MNFLKVASDDIKRIFKNKFIMISVIAIIVVPLLYSILYLDAFWDPYARLEDLKIAVVNLDKGTVLDGEEANYGEDVVDELRNNKEVGWTITNEEDAKEGLEGNEYYAMFVIPENFSQCITSAKEGNPQVAELLFTGNDKKNFITSQVNRQVKSELSAKIISTITNTYVTVAFESLEEVKDGLVEAADGSKQLYDGIDTLHGKVPDLEDGATQLNDGSTKLYNGQVALNDGITAINNGLSELNDKIPVLSSGATELNDGSNQLYNGQVALNDGINSLSAGVSTLNDKLPTLVEGVNALNTGSNDIKNGLSDAKTGSSALAAGSNKLYDAFAGTIYPSVNQLKDGANLLDSSLKVNKDSITALSQGAIALDSASNEVKAGMDTVTGGYNNVADGVNELISSMALSQAAVQAVGDSLTAAIQADPTLLANADIKAAVDTLEQLKAASAAGADKVQTLTKGTEDLRSGMSTLNDSVNLYADKVKEFASGADILAGSVDTVSAGVEQIASGLNALEVGLNEANENSFGEGLSSLKAGANSLDAGLGKLSAGAVQMNAGIENLSSNVPTLSAGVSALYNGTNELKAGSNNLVAGQNALKDGIDTLSANVPTLSAGVSALFNGSEELKAGSDKLVDGQTALREGISKLAGNIPTLVEGVNKLHDGSKELSDALKEGADKITSSLVNEAEEMGDFVAEPIYLDDEAINPVPNYGSGFAPYFILLSLWIGAIMIFFVVPQQTTDDEKLSKFDKAFGKFLSFSFIGIIQAVLVSVSVLVLGLEPTSVPMFFMANVLLSLVFIAIVQCLIFTLGDAGRLLAIVLLILQLTACAGTFPLEVVPSFFQKINPLMPFTYAITALREIVSATVINASVVTKNLGILAVVGVVFLTLTVILKNIGEKIQTTMEERKLETAK